MGSGVAGKVIVLTGASSGLGEQLAGALAAGGARLVLAARRRERLEALAATLAGDPVTVPCDVTDAGGLRALVGAAVARHGRIDGLVNNAGFSKLAPALKEDVGDFRRHLETNLVAPFALAQLVARVMREGGAGGSIVNVASVLGLRSTGVLPEAGYIASKAGLIGLTRELASQWGRYGIRVNAVAPGFFPTEMTEGLADADGTGPAWLLDRTPLGRLGRDGELGGAVAFLLSDAASFVTGQTTVVDGGLATR